MRFVHPTFSRQVAVGDYQVHAQPASGLSGIKSADSRIDADDEANASRGRALDDIVLHAVPFANTVRNMKVGSTTAEFDGGLENDNRGCAVNVIIAVNQDAFLALDGRF